LEDVGVFGDGNAGFDRAKEAVIGNDLILAIAAHGVSTTEAEAFEGEEGVAGKLTGETTDEGEAGRDLLYPLELPQPGNELAVGDDSLILGGSEGVESDAELRSGGKNAIAIPVYPILDEAEGGNF
jgi:hypothetical protein